MCEAKLVPCKHCDRLNDVAFVNVHQQHRHFVRKHKKSAQRVSFRDRGAQRGAPRNEEDGKLGDREERADWPAVAEHDEDAAGHHTQAAGGNHGGRNGLQVPVFMKPRHD